MTKDVRWFRTPRHQKVVELFNVKAASRICIHTRAVSGRDLGRNTIKGFRVSIAITLNDSPVPILKR